jgi:N-acylglucosamine-6-phosphate 2-epimerase
MTSDAIARLKHGLVVSCQAPAQSPLHNPDIIAAIAHAAVLNGAVGVRIDSPDHVRAVRARLDAPIIGLWKQQYPESEVYITPQFHHAEAIATAGADIIAIDATLRSRPENEQLSDLIHRIHTQLGKPVMADIDTLSAAIAAAEAGADIVGTTLFGYTADTDGEHPPGLDLLSAMAEALTVPLICEGGIASPDMANAAFERGAYAVVVGTAITGIDLQVQSYVKAIASAHSSSEMH